MRGLARCLTILPLGPTSSLVLCSIPLRLTSRFRGSRYAPPLNLGVRRLERFPHALTRTALAALAGLPLGSIVVGVVLGLQMHLSIEWAVSSVAPGLLGGLFMAMYATILGVLPTMLLGAPAYAFLRSKGRATAWASLAIGVVPGMTLLPIDLDLGFLFVAFGAGVATCTHLIVRRFPGGSADAASAPCPRA